MPVKLSAVQKSEAIDVRIDYGDDGDLNLKIFPDRFTIGSTRRMDAAMQREDAAGMADEFFSWIGEWDLLDDKGKVYPLDVSTIDKLGVFFVGKLAGEIMDNINPNQGSSTS